MGPGLCNHTVDPGQPPHPDTHLPPLHRLAQPWKIPNRTALPGTAMARGTLIKHHLSMDIISPKVSNRLDIKVIIIASIITKHCSQ